MPARLLPLFPLQVVVFPRTSLQLHIFEERYKLMVGEAIRREDEFGIVLGREQGIASAGCTVAVEKVLERYPDGRMDILTRGRRRFEIVLIDEELDYLRAEVQYFDDEDTAQPEPEVREQALRHFNSLKKLGGAQGCGEPDLADPQLSFQLAQGLPDLNFLNALLRQRSEASRLKQLNQYLADYISRQRVIERVQGVAPTNGFGGNRREL
ncbi:MAG: LON peptidase substrate-binding domain-containing protein [Bryobacteraceae bacterium]